MVFWAPYPWYIEPHTLGTSNPLVYEFCKWSQQVDIAGGKDDKTKYCESQNAVHLEQAKTSIEIRGTYLFYVANSVSQVNVKVS